MGPLLRSRPLTNRRHRSWECRRCRLLVEKETRAHEARDFTWDLQRAGGRDHHPQGRAELTTSNHERSRTTTCACVHFNYGELGLRSLVHGV